MNEFDKIYLIWRKSSGERRIPIGIITKNEQNKYQFDYLLEEINKIPDFLPYIEFIDVNKVYTNNVVEIFAQRLTNNARKDIFILHDFWEVNKEKINDKFYLLGKTQGLTNSDSYEFLADYNLIPNLNFITEIAGLSKKNIPIDAIQIGDNLRYELELDNKYDKYAVKVFKDNVELGWVKTIHNKIFHLKTDNHLKIVVKAVEKNGNLKRIFIKVTNT